MAKTDELELDPNAAKPAGKGKLIIIMVLVVLLTSGAVVGALYFMGALGGGKESKQEDKEHSEEKLPEVKPAFYIDMKPAFIVNFEDQSQAAYLQIEMQAMARDQRVVDAIGKHTPVIRNNILLLLGGQKFDEARTRAGKEALQARVLEVINNVVVEAIKAEIEKAGEGKVKDEDVPRVEQVYFTSFVMQ